MTQTVENSVLPPKSRFSALDSYASRVGSTIYKGSDEYSKIPGSTKYDFNFAPVFAGLSVLADVYNTYQTNKANKEASDKANAFNAAEAASARANQHSLLHEQARLNSVQSQVNQLRQAGLNPALATGQISAGTASAAGSAQGSAVSPVPAQKTDLRVAENALLGAQVENLRSSSALNMSNIATADIQRKYLDTQQQQEIAKQLEEIAKLKSSSALDLSQKHQIDELIDKLKAQYDSIIQLNTSQAGLNVAKEGAVSQEVAESRSRENLNKAQTRTEGFKQTQMTAEAELAMQKGLTEETVRDLNAAVKRYNEVSAYKIALENRVTSKQQAMIFDYVKDHDLPAGSAGLIFSMLDEFAKSVGSNVPGLATDVLKSWLDGGNWLRFFAQRGFNHVLSESGSSSAGTSSAETSSAETSSSEHVPKSDGKSEGSNSRTPFSNHINYLLDNATPAVRKRYEIFNRLLDTFTYGKRYGIQVELWNCKKLSDLERLMDKYVPVE